MIEDAVKRYGVKNVFVHNDICNGDIPNINARLFSGHIHSPLIRKSKGLYNLGSCFSIDFSDSNSERGFYELSDNDVKFIANEHSIRYWRLFNDEIFNDCARTPDDYIELYITQSNMTRDDFAAAIDGYIKKYKNIWIIPQITVHDSIENIKFEGYDI